MTIKSDKAAAELVGRLGYEFKDISLLHRALTHASAVGKRFPANNERLEFLGDRVLGLVIAHALYERHEDVPEGELARMFNSLVRREACLKVAKAINLGDALVLAGRGVKRTRLTDKILADGCEAVIAAIYLDGGLDAAFSFIKAQWAEPLKNVTKVRKDPKSALQEWAASKNLPMPDYEIIDTSGPDHLPVFTVELSVEGRENCTAASTTRRAAEHDAAAKFLSREGIWRDE